MKNLRDKVVIVTGGASGLGRAMVERFVEEGARVVVADYDAAGGEAIAARTASSFVRTDVADPASVEAAVAFAVERHGRLDVLVNNAGVESARAPIHECTLENWRRVIDVNLDGVFHGMKYALAQMVAQGEGGAIVNITSTAGLVGVPNLPPYAAAKAGVANLTRAAAIEYGRRNIRVNAVAPTGVMTDLFQRMAGREADPQALLDRMQTMNPLSGSPSPADIAAAVAFLASDDARFVSGVILPVDGGFTAQ